ncbi:MAG: EamA family transporter [Nibricoccus sp.]
MIAAPDHRPSRTAFIVAFASIYIIWGSTYLGIRVAVETIPPFFMGAGRFLLAGLVLLLVVQWRGAARPTVKQWRDNAIIGAFLLLGGNGLVSWAEKSLHSGLTALIIGIQPVFMVLTEWAWPGGHRPGRATFLGLVLGFAGVAYLVSPWQDTATTNIHLPSVALVLLACASWAFGSIWSRHVKNPAPAFQASALQMIGGSASLFLGGILHGEFATFKFSAISGASVGAFFYLAFVGSLVGFSTFVWLMKNTTPARVSTYAYVNPVVAVFLGWLILREEITHRTLLATALIVTGVVIINTQKARQPKLSAKPAGPLTPQPASSSSRDR